VSGAKGTAEPLRYQRLVYLDRVCLPKRVDRFDIGYEQQVTTRLIELPRVGIQGLWISIEILGVVELSRIDEDADHDTIGYRPSMLNQTQVPGVQITHCGYKGNPFTGGTPIIDDLRKISRRL